MSWAKSSLTLPIDTKSSVPNLDPKAMPFNLEESSKKNPNRLDLDALTILNNIRVENLKNVTIGQLNINSLRNKIHDLAELIKGNLDILVITETKLDYTFPEKQFLIPGYKKPFRRDRNVNGGGVMIYVREDIPCDILLKHVLPENIEAIFIEIIVTRERWCGDLLGFVVDVIANEILSHPDLREYKRTSSLERNV